MKDLANFGDSVHWGQGHLLKDKFAFNLAQSLSLELQMAAHSGATIGAGEPCAGSADPEVPFACPSILQQVANYSKDPANTALVLVNGGINDVTVQRLLNPFAKPSDIARVTRHYCHRDMIVLLREIVAKFGSRIILTSYFPIFSSKSDLNDVLDLLDGYMIAVPRGPQFRLQQQLLFERVVANAQAFWKESTAALQDAIRNVGSDRVRFANVPFTDENAMFAGTSWLFEVRLKGGQLVPEDPVAEQRKKACNDFHELPFDRMACYIASAGHPNLPGSKAFLDTIKAVA